MDTPTFTRRRSIALAGTTAALGLTGLALGSGNARAQVAGDFDIQGGTFTPEDNQLAALYVTASGGWQYSGLDTAADEWRVYLLVDAPGNPGDWEAIGMTSGGASGTKASGTYAIRGEVTAASHYGGDTFDVSDGQPVDVSIPLSVLLLIRDGSGNTLATAEAIDTVPVTVNPGGSISALGGSGTLHGLDNSSDPTPTVPSGGA